MSKIGDLRLALLSLLAEHERDNMLPTSGRFLFYELVQRGIISKDKTPTKPDRSSARQPAQNVSDALMALREAGEVPWEWIADEKRSITYHTTYESIRAGVIAKLPYVRLDPWGGNAPFVLTESRSLAGVLSEICSDHGVPIAATNGQCGGFLHTDVAPALRENQRVLYMGDWDLAGNDIEANTRRVLEHDPDNWERIALTEEQVGLYSLPIIIKHDKRFKDHRPHWAVETEALSQRVITEILLAKLTELLPEPLDHVQVRAAAEREEIEDLLS